MGDATGWSVSDRYDVVVNGRGQYSLWPDERPLPTGWDRVGFTGSEADCLSHISVIWQDIRPQA